MRPGSLEGQGAAARRPDVEGARDRRSRKFAGGGSPGAGCSVLLECTRREAESGESADCLAPAAVWAQQPRCGGGGQSGGRTGRAGCRGRPDGAGWQCVRAECRWHCGRCGLRMQLCVATGYLAGPRPRGAPLQALRAPLRSTRRTRAGVLVAAVLGFGKGDRCCARSGRRWRARRCRAELRPAFWGPLPSPGTPPGSSSGTGSRGVSGHTSGRGLRSPSSAARLRARLRSQCLRARLRAHLRRSLGSQAPRRRFGHTVGFQSFSGTLPLTDPGVGPAGSLMWASSQRSGPRTESPEHGRRTAEVSGPRCGQGLLRPPIVAQAGASSAVFSAAGVAAAQALVRAGEARGHG